MLKNWTFSELWFIAQIDSMLACVWNRSQMTSKCDKNKKSGTRGDSRVCHWCYHHILTSSVIYYGTDARQHGMCFFYIVKRQIIQNFVCFNRKRVERILSSFWQTFENSHLAQSIFYTSWSKFIGYGTNQRILIGPDKSRSCQTWIERCRHLCVCPLTDHSWEPIKRSAELSWFNKITCKLQDFLTVADENNKLIKIFVFFFSSSVQLGTKYPSIGVSILFVFFATCSWYFEHPIEAKSPLCEPPLTFSWLAQTTDSS